MLDFAHAVPGADAVLRLSRVAVWAQGGDPWL